MAEKREVLKPVGTPSYSKSKAVEIIRQLKAERLQQRREDRAARKK